VIIFGFTIKRHKPLQEDQVQTTLEMEKEEDASRKTKEALFETESKAVKAISFSRFFQNK